jgi:uncharacterized membrane protein YgcG
MLAEADMVLSLGLMTVAVVIALAFVLLRNAPWRRRAARTTTSDDGWAVWAYSGTSDGGGTNYGSSDSGGAGCDSGSSDGGGGCDGGGGGDGGGGD